MKIRTVTSLRDFDALGGLWREVTRASGQRSILLSHDWFACCWRTAGAARARELWIVEDVTGPIALIPLVRGRARYRGLPARTLQLMHPPDSPMADFPVVGAVDDVMNAVVERLSTHDDWDVFFMPGLATHSPLWKVMESSVGARLPWRIADRTHLPYVTLSSRNAALRTSLETLQRAIAPTVARSGDTITVEEHRGLDPRGPLFDEIMSVVRNASRTPASLPAATGEEVRRFFRELTARANGKGWLSLWVLRLEGRVVETEYQLVSDGCAHALRRDADQSPPGLRLRDVLTLQILQTLLARPAIHTYLGTPVDPDDSGVPGTSRQETVFAEFFARRSYAHLVHRVESHVASLARRFGRQGGSECA